MVTVTVAVRKFSSPKTLKILKLTLSLVVCLQVLVASAILDWPRGTDIGSGLVSSNLCARCSETDNIEYCFLDLNFCMPGLN